MINDKIDQLVWNLIYDEDAKPRGLWTDGSPFENKKSFIDETLISIGKESKALWVNMMLAWNMNNGTDGFIDFHANHHNGFKGTEERLRKMVEEDESISDHWIQEQYDRWFGKDRFMKMACYHSVDDENQFFNWLISKSLQN